jgi:hypothetical protein
MRQRPRDILTETHWWIEFGIKNDFRVWDIPYRDELNEPPEDPSHSLAFGKLRGRSSSQVSAGRSNAKRLIERGEQTRRCSWQSDAVSVWDNAGKQEEINHLHA